MSEEEPSADASQGGGGKPPVFSGKGIDYADWKTEAGVWAHVCRKPKDKIAGLLFLAQDQKMVKKVMMSITEEKMNSENGYKLMMEAMDKKYLKPADTLSWAHFDRFDTMTRGKNERSEDFLLRFELAFTDAQRYDSKLQSSPRMLALMALKRMQISRFDRAQILAGMKDEVNLETLQQALDKFYDEKDVPWVSNGGADTIAETVETFAAFDSGEDIALFVKRFGKQPGPGVTCHRCGKSGHIARDCETDWAKCKKIFHANGFSGVAVEFIESEDDEEVDEEVEPPPFRF